MEDYFFDRDNWNWLEGGIVLLVVQAILPAVLKESLPVKKIRRIMAILGAIGVLKFEFERCRWLREQMNIIERK